MPSDQQGEDVRAACFDGAPLKEDTLVLGAPTLEVELSAEAGQRVAGNLVARLCAVAPDGESTRLSYGVLNLSAEQWGASAHTTVYLNYTARIVPAGYRLRVAVSRDYWPI
eukprot:2071542-Pyramimonas_sp.AAC.1